MARIKKIKVNNTAYDVGPDFGDKGSATNPVYFNDGEPVACTYSLKKTVPSDAKFTDTDTTYELAASTNSTNGTVNIGLTPSDGSFAGRVYFHGYGATSVTTNDLGNIVIQTADATTTRSGLMSASDKTKLDGITATATELNYCSGVKSNIQTQLDGKVDISEASTNSLSHLKNGKGGVLNWLWVTGSDGNTDYTLVPRGSSGTKYDAYLGDESSPFLGLYTGFIDASGVIQSSGNMVCGGSLTTEGNIVTSNVTASGNLYAQGSNNGGGIVQAKKQLYSEGILTVADTAAIGGVTTVAARIQPNPNSTTVNLGYNDVAGHRWSNIYSKTAVNVSSDEKVKTNLERIDDKYIQLFDLVQPYSYQFIDGTSGRTHTGFVSQHVEAAMKEVGLESTDLAFFCKDPLYKEVRNEEGEIVDTEPSLDENGNQEYFYSLRYEEYIAIMTEKIKRMEQKYTEEKADFEARLSTLESKLSLM